MPQPYDFAPLFVECATLQRLADDAGIGAEWRAMIAQRTPEAAELASDAAMNAPSTGIVGTLCFLAGALAAGLAASPHAIAGTIIDSDATYAAEALGAIAELKRALGEQHMNRATEFLGLREYGTGGNCTALRMDHSDGAYTLITDALEPIVPATMDTPCAMCFYDSEDAQEPSEDRTFPTLRAALLELYGPIAGQPLPEELR